MKLFPANSRGQALVELALALPIFLILIFALIKSSYILLSQQTITYAAREGARAGALTNNNDQIKAAVWNAVAPIDTISESGEAKYTQIIISPQNENDPDRQRGGELTVIVKYPFHLQIPYVEAGSIILQSQSKVRIEHES